MTRDTGRHAHDGVPRGAGVLRKAPVPPKAAGTPPYLRRGTKLKHPDEPIGLSIVPLNVALKSISSPLRIGPARTHHRPRAPHPVVLSTLAGGVGALVHQRLGDVAPASLSNRLRGGLLVR